MLQFGNAFQIISLNITMILCFNETIWNAFQNCSILNVYCPECPPRGTIVYPGGQQKKFLLFGHGRDLAAFNGTGL